MKVLTTDSFIRKSRCVHGDEYDYSHVEYKNAKNKVKIICKEHGEFSILPFNHLKGQGCPICRYVKSANSNRLDFNAFLERARKVHGNKYDYSKVKYVRNTKKVCIICPEHGEFWQTPSKHTDRGQGCPYCSGNARKTNEKFIDDAKKVHGDKYDYSKVEYKCNNKVVCITCPKHGDFWQRPKDHIKGQGCPKCKQSKIENDVFNFLTENNIEFITQYKYDNENQKNRIDFFIPEKKIAIECQGEQHFKPVDFAKKGDEWANKLFEKNLLNDKHKHVLCEKMGIKLIYYVPKKNTVPGYKSDEKFCGIYNDNNVCNTIKQLNVKV